MQSPRRPLNRKNRECKRPNALKTNAIPWKRSAEGPGPGKFLDGFSIQWDRLEIAMGSDYFRKGGDASHTLDIPAQGPRTSRHLFIGPPSGL